MIASASSRLRDAAFESSCAQSGLNALTGIPLKIVKTFVCIENSQGISCADTCHLFCQTSTRSCSKSSADWSKH